jgi:hypothetical protein
VPGDYATIQAAIDAAVVGDVVEIACGSYQVPEIIMKSGITLRSAMGQADCVILEPADLQSGQRRLFRCVADDATAIEGITFRYGVDGNGGPIYFEGAPQVRRCRFHNNSGRFLRERSATNGPGVSCYIAGGAVAFFNSTAIVEDCEFFQNYSNQGGVSNCGETTFLRCTFSSSASEWSGGGLTTSGGSFTECSFSGNHAYAGGGGADALGAVFEACTFEDNDANMSGGAASVSSGCLFDKCILTRNYTGTFASQLSLPGGGAIQVYGNGDPTTIRACTFVSNDASPPVLSNGLLAPTMLGAIHGSAILVSTSTPIVIESTVVSANTGCEAIYCDGSASVSVSCSNIFGNPDGDWTGCIAGQLGVSGNISVDPMFCDAANGDFHLSSLSPCLYAECGVMGALGQGCFDAKPALFSVKDVGNDQGRQVRLTWQRSVHDAPTANPYVVGYAVYRKQGQFASGDVKDTPLPQAARGEGVAIVGWDYLGTVPSRGDSVYETVVPTLCDSTITSGPCLSTFFISAMTSNPFIYYDSPQHSGYSKDNLAPPTPTSFAIAYNTGNGNHLSWDAVAAGDFAGFRVYRDNVFVASTTQTSWTDPAFDGWNVHYNVTSFDIAGNESAPTTGGITTAVPSVTPQQLELLPNVPNPFNPTTQIRFATPSEGMVRVAIFDARGALVRVLVDKSFPAGHHSAVWDGRDGKGSAVSSGVYLCRLEQRSESRTRKIVLIK